MDWTIRFWRGPIEREPIVQGNLNSPSEESSTINWSAFWRALAAPLAFWVIMVGAVIVGGQLGVICVTPMAWLLATWSGTRYISLAGGRPARRPLLGAALLGVLLGVAEGIFFTVVTTSLLPPATPEDASKTLILDIVVFGAGIPICAGLSVFTAMLTLKRFARELRG